MTAFYCMFLKYMPKNLVVNSAPTRFPDSIVQDNLPLPHTLLWLKSATALQNYSIYVPYDTASLNLQKYSPIILLR